MRDTARLRRKILARAGSVAVLGQGYVGLTVACAAAVEGFDVLGIDVDAERVASLARGDLVVPGVPGPVFREGIASGRLRFATEIASVAEADVVLICVPTPLKDQTPDLSYVQRAAADVGSVLTAGTLVVLESTTYPGTTEEIVLPELERGGLRGGVDFLLAYSPERIDPGNEEYGLRNTPRVVGGLGPEATAIGALFYEQLVDKVVVVSSARSAELAKLLENTYRHVNIALVNEMAMLCHDMGIDIWEVIEASASKPFGFMRFVPGPGVGGHCIPLDPEYLAWRVRRDAGRQFRILGQAQDINAAMPRYVSTRIGDALNDRGKAVRGASVLILGVTYKPNVGDLRESPALHVMGDLIRRGARVSFHDPHVATLSLAGGREIASSDLTQRLVAHADCVALLTPHSDYDLEWLATHAPLLLDATNAYGGAVHQNVVRL